MNPPSNHPPDLPPDEDGMGTDAMPEGCVNAMGSLMPLLFGLSQDGGSSCPLGHRIQSHGAPDLPGRTSREHIPTKMDKGPDKGFED